MPPSPPLLLLLLLGLLYGYQAFLHQSTSVPIKLFHRKMASTNNENNVWSPPEKIEEIFGKLSNNKFASINSPIAGARSTADVPVGDAHLQLYSLGTPNGQKVSILLEELKVDYDAHVINIGAGEQFTSGFVAINPNSKIPALVDRSGPDGNPINLFESGSIMIYLAEKYGQFIPKDPRHRAEVMNWVFWQMAGFGPMCGNFGHFMVYAPPDQVQARDYGVGRYGMEVQRLCSVLDQHLAGKQYMVGEEYIIADMIILPWFHQLMVGYKHPSGIAARDFLSIDQYKNAMAWAERLLSREEVKRGLTVCTNGKAKPWVV